MMSIAIIRNANLCAIDHPLGDKWVRSKKNLP
ncbi:hypothetical protein B0G80_9206 [Paraburkholderia sp. BL6669N2]|nr:hypothetical protein B0G75_1204 [Paraburkholderia sp. BL18I3N2]PRX90739.1 hypothetical protein B0G73_14236 [Paraburkholderia sp. BL25I1N1]REG45583.1 hypothetical protein B0G80_9206 [Paraburkholderia sp. BL6669N2]